MFLIKLGEYYLTETRAAVDTDDHPVLTRFQDKAWQIDEEDLADAWRDLVNGEKICLQ